IIITDTYYCPHHPTKGVGRFLKECGCRKPEPGMLLNAIRDHRIDPEKSFMIGDKIADVEAGIRAGVTGILVRTGYGETEASGKEIPIADNLLEAVDRWILR
ncbi:HAD-IIIA family hydrolase, partial [bacterium]|nr:HAD-IIIA family hydrolase [bacterium]